MILRRRGHILAWLLLLALLLGFMVEARPTEAASLAQSTIQRIRFAPGATGAVVDGNVSSGKVARYVLGAAAGQYMTVQVFSDNAPVLVNIFDTNQDFLG